VQAIGRQPQRAPDGAPLHYERHRPEQTTLYRLLQRHAMALEDTILWLSPLHQKDGDATRLSRLPAWRLRARPWPATTHWRGEPETRRRPHRGRWQPAPPRREQGRRVRPVVRRARPRAAVAAGRHRFGQELVGRRSWKVPGVGLLGLVQQLADRGRRRSHNWLCGEDALCGRLLGAEERRR